MIIKSTAEDEISDKWHGQEVQSKGLHINNGHTHIQNNWGEMNERKSKKSRKKS